MKDILKLRENGWSWESIANYLELGSEASARRHHAKAKKAQNSDPKISEALPPEPSSPFTLYTETKVSREYVPPIPREDPTVYELVPVAGRDLLRVLFVGDAHIPYENKASWALMMTAMIDFKPDIIVITGDFGDMKAVSSHLKNPIDKTRLKWEVEQINLRLDELDELGASTKIYIAGNHEDRLQRYLQEKAPELFDFLNVPQLLALEDRRWEYVPYKQHTEIGALYATHDVGTAGVNSARKALDTFMHSVVTAHSHRLQYVVEGDAVGGARVSATFGWLGDINEIEYMSRARSARDWAQGFGVGYLNAKNQAVHLVPVPIVLGTVVLEGKLYSVKGD